MSILDEVMTLQEAAMEWKLDDSTLRHAIRKNKFKSDEVRKSANTWLILKSAMVRLYGEKVKPITIYTTGYEGRTINDFINTLKENKVDMIFDIREIPISRKKGFSKSSLEIILKANNIKYVHFKKLGSPKQIRDRLRVEHDYETLFNEYRKYLDTQEETIDILNTAISSHKDMRFCLMCFEKDPEMCHRSIVAEKISNSLQDAVNIVNL